MARAPASIDLITCAQAIHWFNAKEARQEFDRILKRGGMIALIWNDHRRDYGLGHACEEIKSEYSGEEFKTVAEAAKDMDAFFLEFFGCEKYETKLFDNFQELDERGFVGRLFSSSYAPKPSTPRG